jgi:large repetitive protein
VAIEGLGGEVAALGTAIGLLRAEPGGTLSLRSDFFQKPAHYLGGMISDPVQRDALLTAIEGLLETGTPSTLDGAGRSYHPLLHLPDGAPVRGQLFLCVRRDADGSAELGVAAEVSPAGGGPALTLDMPLLAASGSALSVVAASTQRPVRVELRVPFGADGSSLRAALLLVAPPDLAATRFLVGVYRPGAPPLEFDPVAAPAGLAHLVGALLEAIFGALGPGVPAEVAQVALALPGVLGLTADLPAFPFASLGGDPGAAVRGWLASMATATLSTGDSVLAVWLDSVGRLLGAAPATAFPLPTEAAPAVVPIITGTLTLALTMAVRTAADSGSPVLLVGLRGQVEAAGTPLDAALALEAVLLALPLSGTAPATVLESLDLLVRAPAGGGPLVGTGPVRVGGLAGGLRYAGGAVSPVLRLTGVDLGGGRTFPVIDLADTQTLGAVADTVVDSALADGLGAVGEIVAALRVLVGLRAAAPALDLARFASAPLEAIAAYYRALLGSPAGWQELLTALWRLLGGGGTAPQPAGAGIRTDPWRVPVAAFAAPAGALPGLALAVWNDSAPGDPVLRPRVGLRVAVAGGAVDGPQWTVAAAGELLGFDLPPAGAVAARFLGRQSVRAQVSSLPAATIDGQPGVSADRISAELSWVPGAPLAVGAAIEGVRVGGVALGTIRLPFEPDLTDPALGLGIDPADLWAGLRMLVGRAAASWGGAAGAAIAALLGVGTPGALGVPGELPPLALPDPADIGSLLSDPGAAFRAWLAAVVAAGVAADGAPLLGELRRPLQAYLTGSLPALAGLVPDPAVPPAGAGNWSDPWTVPLQAAGEAPVELLGWLEPTGPPLPWVEPLLADLEAALPDPEALDAAAPETGALDAAGLGERLGGLAPYLGDDVDPARAAGAIGALAGALAGTDGVVPVGAALPEDPGWERAAYTVPAAHHLLPRHPDAVALVAERIGALTAAPAGWAVLLLAPDLAGDGCWDPLLAACGGTAQAVDLRQPGVAPALVDLGALSAGDWYDVRLADGGRSLTELTAQLTRVAEQVRALRPAARLLLVAHSTAGPVAEAWVAANAAASLGLVTLGAPLAPVTVPGAGVTGEADGIRLVRRLAPDGLGSAAVAVPALNDALDLLAGSTLGAGSFARGAATRPDLHGVPAFAVAGSVVGELLPALAATLAWRVRGSGAGEDVTHLGYGLRVGLGLPAADSTDPLVEATVRLDLGRLTLAAGAPEPPHPARALAVTVRLGAPGEALMDTAAARVGTVEMSFVLGAAGSAAGIRLRDTVLDGVPAAVVDLGDPLAPALLDRLVAQLLPTAAPGGRLAAVLDALRDLGVITAAGAVSADTVGALRTDPAAYLGARLPALLDRPGGLLGIRATGGTERDTWRLRPGALPVELVVRRGPWRVGVATTGDGLVTALDGRMTGTATMTLSTMDTVVTGDVSVAGMRLVRDAGTLSLTHPWLAAPVALVPPDTVALRDTLLPLLPRILVDAAAGALLEAIAGRPLRIAPLSGLVTDPAGWLARTFGDGTLPRPDVLNTLLAAAATAAGLDTDAARPLVLPGGIVLAAAPAAGGGLALTASMPERVLVAGGPSLALDFGLTIDAARHVAPGGDIAVRVPLPAGAAWESLALRFGAHPGGLAAAVEIGHAGGVPPTLVTLLPAVGGLADLLATGATLLLPEVLDALAGAVPAGQGKAAALSVAQALDLYDPALAPAGFAAKQAVLAALVEDLRTGNVAALIPAAATAVGNLLRLVLGPATIPPPPTPTTVAVRLPNLPVVGGTLEIAADLAHVPPAVLIRLSDVDLGVVRAGVAVGYRHPDLTADLTIDALIPTGRGVDLAPRLHATYAAGRLAVELLPLPTTAPTFAIALAPNPAPPTPEQLLRLAEEWVVPLAATLALQAAEEYLDRPLWTGAAKTAKDVLVDAGIADQQLQFTAVPLPPPAQLLTAAIRALEGLEIPLPGELSLSIQSDGPLLGLQVSGQVAIPAGDYEVDIKFGAPDTVAPWGDAGDGPTIFLLDTSDPAHPEPAARLRLGGFGLKVGGAPGEDGKAAPLVDTNGFRLGAAAAYITADFDLIGPNAFQRPAQVDGAIELDQIGLPLSPSGEGSNPVASNMVGSGGSGDTTPANPPLDLNLYGGSRGWGVGFNGKEQVRLDVHRTFGPLHIDDIILSYDGTPTTPGKFGVGIDGGVSISGLVVDVQGLILKIPVRTPTDLRQWEVDLAGLAASFQTSSVSIAGGLVKRALAGGGIEYDGTLSVSVAGRGLTAIGSYAEPGGGADKYTSLFVFVVLNVPLGGPPYLFITGLAGGFGYNRRLLAPSDPAAVPSFPLVAAMDGFAGSSPMEALDQISRDIPPARGAYWLAVGIKFSTFELLQTIALAYGSFDNGQLEVGVLGLMRLALPPGEPLVNLELALAARYSTVDQLLSIRAALTRNSWLISKDCRLTGGFAFMLWFGKPEALLTVGGYGPIYKAKPYYPVLDPVGFHWQVTEGIVVKGGQYFVLAPDGIAFGGSIEASYDVAPVRVWFTAYVDVLVYWDPISYHLEAGIVVGASFHFEVCFFACVTINVELSLSAVVEINGPPLHGTVTIDLDVVAVVVEFGAVAPQEALSWDLFRVRYLTGGDAAGAATQGGIAAGIRTVEMPQGAQFPPKPDGASVATAWPVGPAFTVRVESRMPAMRYRIGGAAAQAPAFAVPGHVDVVPALGSLPPVSGTLVIGVERFDGAGFVVVPDADLSDLRVAAASGGFPAALWVGGQHDGSGDTMLGALGSLQLTAPLTVAEETGSLGTRAVPFARLVTEEPSRPLPFGRAGLSTLVPEPVPVVLPAVAGDPVLRALAREAQVWDVDAHGGPAEVVLDGGTAARVVALSATGTPLRDASGPVRRVAGVLPAGTATVVVAPAGAVAGSAGWQADTPLLQVAPGTLLGDDCQVITPRIFVPRRGLRRLGAEVHVPAAEVASAMPSLVTVLPDWVETVVISLDRRAPGADIGMGDVEVSAGGGRLGAAAVSGDGCRTTLTLPVLSVDGPGLRVCVASAADWWLAGVSGSAELPVTVAALAVAATGPLRVSVRRVEGGAL